MKQLLLTLFAWLIFTPVWAQQAKAPTAKTFLHANRIRMGEIVPGGLQWKILQPGFYADTFNSPVIVDYNGAPKPVAGIERMGLWLGALDSAGEIRVSCLIPPNNSNRSPFVAGPLSGVWPADSLASLHWDRFFQVSGVELAYHRADWADNGVLDDPLPAVTGWPGKGNPHFETQYGFPLPEGDLAPFIDMNSDGIYNAYDGDCPHPAGLDPDVLPGQIIWNIFNDGYGKFLDVSLGLEIHQTTWALLCDTDSLLNETAFFNFKIKNKSGAALDSFSAGIWMLPLLGNFYDDGFGTSVEHNGMFVFNVDSLDEKAQFTNIPYHFGANPPVFAFSCLNRPLYKSIYHFFPLLCDPPLNMLVPGNPTEYFRSLNGYWRDGAPQTRTNTGYDWNNTGAPLAPYIYPDDPNDPDGWSFYANYISCRFDAAILPSFYFNKLKPDSAVSLDLAFSYHRGPGLNHLQNVTYMYNRLDALQDHYDQGFAGSCAYTPCTDDCVWPGDLNRDGIVDHADLLPLGVGWGNAGPDRPAPATWAPHDAPDWNVAYNQNYDFKHLDANGDGSLDSLDWRISLNYYGFTVPAYQAPPDSYPMGTDLIVAHNGPQSVDPNYIKPGNWVFPRVVAKNIPELYGAAFTLEYDTAYWNFSLAVSNGPGIRYVQPNVGSVDISAVLTDQATSFNGYSLLATRLFPKTISASLPDSTFLRLKNIRGIRADGSELALGARALRYCFTGKCAPLVGAQEAPAPDFVFFPNPAKDRVWFSAPGQTWERIAAFDQAGRLLRRWDAAGRDEALLDLAGLPSGWVLFQIQTMTEVLAFRVLVQK